MVSLRPITDANREAVEALAVAPDQARYVSGVRESLLEAAEHPDAQALYWAIYAEEKPVGLVCLSVAARDGARIDRTLQLPGNRAMVRERTTTVAMHLLRRLLDGRSD